MNASTPNLSTQLNQVQIAIARYFLLPVYVLGNIGNIANIILFSQRKLRLNNVCAWYFIGVSLANLLGLTTGGLTRILALSNNFTLESTSIIFCKFRNYFIQSGAVVGRYFLCLISIDRWMITSSDETIRGMSSSKTGRYLIIFGVSGCACFSVHIPIGFQIRNGRCYAYLNEIYAIFFNVYNLVIIFLPLIIMSLFSLLTLRNIRHSRSRVEPSSTAASATQQALVRSNRQRDMQFIRLAFGQVLVFLTFIVTYGIYNMYDLVTGSQMKDLNQRAVESFTSGVVVNLNYVSISVRLKPFLLNTFHTSLLDHVLHIHSSIEDFPTRMCINYSSYLYQHFTMVSALGL